MSTQTSAAFLSRRPLDWRSTLEVGLFGLAQIPVIAFVGPRVEQNDEQGCRLRIPLNYRTRNHLGSLYFGVLAVGADLVSGLPAVRMSVEEKRPLSLAFKDLHAEFLRRAEGDTVFENVDTAAIRQAFEETVRTGRRVNLPVQTIATVPSIDPETPVARFTTTLSIRYDERRQTPWYQKLLR